MWPWGWWGVGARDEGFQVKFRLELCDLGFLNFSESVWPPEYRLPNTVVKIQELREEILTHDTAWMGLKDITVLSETSQTQRDRSCAIPPMSSGREEPVVPGLREGEGSKCSMGTRFQFGTMEMDGMMVMQR